MKDPNTTATPPATPPGTRDPVIDPGTRRGVINANRQVYLRFVGLAMHAELNTAGAQHEAADALIAAADANGQTINDRIADNAFSLADAMIDAMIRRGLAS